MLGKNIVVLFLICVSAITANADTDVSNSYGPGNIDANGNFVDPVFLLPESTVRNLLIVKYTAFYYSMKPIEFSQFFAKYNLPQSTDLKSSTNIVRVANLTNKELDILNRALSKKIYGMEMVVPPTGRYYCDINGGVSCEGPNILFKPQVSKGKVAVKISINQANTSPESFSFSSEALLSNIKNKNYIVITQIKKHDTLYGQIILIAFGK